MPATLGLLAVRLLGWTREAGGQGLIHLSASEGRAERLGRILSVLAPDLDVIVLPPWDCLPYDRASPSRIAMGRRIAALARLSARGDAPCLVLATPDAALQRLPPREILKRAALTLTPGDLLPLDTLEARFVRLGYVPDDRVDEPGEVAILGQVIDIFPSGEDWPLRIEHEDGRILAIRTYDPATQLTSEEDEAGLASLTILPASELVLPEPDEGAEPIERTSGLEHRLSDFYPGLETLFDYLPQARLVREPRAEDRASAAREQLDDSYRSRTKANGGETRPLPPDRLYLTEAEWSERLAAPGSLTLTLPDDGESDAVSDFATERRPNEALGRFVAKALDAGQRVVLAAASARDARSLVGRLKRRFGTEPDKVADWAGVLAAKPGQLLAFAEPVAFDEGFADATDSVTVVTAADLLGSRAASGGPEVIRPAEFGDELMQLRIGDAVIHLEHGMGRLAGLETVSHEATGTTDTVRLEYAGEAKLMVPVDELDQVWRYGSDAESVTLDRLDSEAWAKRRAKVEAEIVETAGKLVDMAEMRQSGEAEKLVPPRRDYERFVARFPFTETPDQAQTIAAILRDLASGRAMERLVCGDVGFGKTEVALRAAAAAALAGRQVAIVAPTTVLVRQHVETFRRRFADLGIEVAQLSRLVKPAEARQVKKGLADGTIRIVIGTHALAAKGVAFKELGLVIVDEEQRFGTAHKAKLKALSAGIHVLTLTATPIPRTLQAALVGLQDLSLLTTPPAERRPVRTFLTPFDDPTVRDALMRERRRGGQSFVVVPRVEDIEPMTARLKALVPELTTLVAHGKLPAEEVDETMVRFADGDGDVLLATNIIESGLDVPRANTMLLWRADRFGLSQLHQLRGRVGRGRARGIAYLLTDPEQKIAPATRKRLETLESLDRLGAGFAISAQDLDQRGAGDLFGEEQAGHVKLIGSSLYRHLLERALHSARGEPVEADWSPELNLGLAGFVPEDYVPDPEVRLNLYARIARMESDETATLADEIEDRFGDVPAPVEHLLAAARLKALCRPRRIARLDAGPQAIALTFRQTDETKGIARDLDLDALGQAAGAPVEWRGERLVLARETSDAERLTIVEAFVSALP